MVFAFLLFARRSANVLGARTYLVVKPKWTLSISWFLIESRKRHRLFRVTQKDVQLRTTYPNALRQDKKSFSTLDAHKIALVRCGKGCEEKLDFELQRQTLRMRSKICKMKQD